MRFLTSLLAACAVATICAPAVAAPPTLPTLPTLNCQLHYGGQIFNAEFKPGGPAYETRAVEAGRFRVKAIIAEQGSQAALVKIYSYYEQDDRFSLLHMARHNISLQPGMHHVPLSGTKNYIYAPGLGHELSYECFLSLPD